MPAPFELRGLDGANPLGFLAAVGTFASLHEAGLGEAKLWWKLGSRWIPLLDGIPARDEDELVQLVAESLKGATVTPQAEDRRAKAQREMETAYRALTKKNKDIKKRRLRGAERLKAIEDEVRPLEEEYERKRREWLNALREAVPRPELALGRGLHLTTDEYRMHVDVLAVGARLTSRGPLDLLAAFGSDACRQAYSKAIEPTPFCFIPRGSSQQYFLDTVRQLVGSVTTDNVRRALFRPWDYRDEKLSLRWDPVEDRRYALLDTDPSDNAARTVWMANLLGYRALALFPTAPMRGRLAAAGWDAEGRYFTWPLWAHALSLDSVRSLVQLRGLVKERLDPTPLVERGIVAVFRSSLVRVGQGINRKLNFSPARQVAGVSPFEEQRRSAAEVL